MTIAHLLIRHKISVFDTLTFKIYFRLYGNIKVKVDPTVFPFGYLCL